MKRAKFRATHKAPICVFAIFSSTPPAPPLVRISVQSSVESHTAQVALLIYQIDPHLVIRSSALTHSAICYARDEFGCISPHHKDTTVPGDTQMPALMANTKDIHGFLGGVRAWSPEKSLCSTHPD